MSQFTSLPKPNTAIQFVTVNPLGTTAMVVAWELNPNDEAEDNIWGVEVEIADYTTDTNPPESSWFPVGKTAGNSIIVTRFTSAVPLDSSVLYGFRLRAINAQKQPLAGWVSAQLDDTLTLVSISGSTALLEAPANAANRNIAAANAGVNLTTVSRTCSVLSQCNYKSVAGATLFKLHAYCAVEFTTPATLTPYTIRIRANTTNTVISSKTFRQNEGIAYIELWSTASFGTILDYTVELLGTNNNVQFGSTYISIEYFSSLPFG